MHGTFKTIETQESVAAELPQVDRKAAARTRALIRKAREEAFRRDYARAKATPVPTTDSPVKTMFC